MSLQPASTEFASRTAAIIEGLKGLEGPLLPILHGIQEEFGYVPRDAVPLIAEALNLSRAEVHGVVTFYHDFRSAAAPAAMCSSSAAPKPASRWAASARRAARAALGIGFHETTRDGAVTLEAVYCLGLCACRPPAMIDGQVVGRLDDDKLDAIAARGALHEPAHLRSLAMPARSRSAPTRSPRRSQRELAARGVDVEIVRNGSRGLFWLEPLVEVETADGPRRLWPGRAGRRRRPARRRLPRRRRAHSCARPDGGDPLPRAADAPDLRPLRHHRPAVARRLRGAWRLAGPARRPWRSRRRRSSTKVTQSGLRGRGGAGFPTGIKWKTVLDTTADQKYIVCNADEGDCGTFADRMIMEGDPFVLIEGMAIAGIAVGATKGYVYIRSEYPHAIATMNAAIAIARRGGVLGASVLGSATPSTWRCASAPAPMSAARRPRCSKASKASAAMVRAKPPLPAHQGPVRQADGDQQRPLARLRADHPRQGRRGLQGLRHGPLARHDADPARRQHQARRACSRPPSA